MAKSSKKTNADKSIKYVIYRLEDETKADSLDKYFPKKIVMQHFTAKDDDAAYNYLKKYRKVANKAYTYYYGQQHEHVVINDDGTKTTYTDRHDLIESWTRHRSIWEKISFEFSYMLSKVKDGWYWLKYLWYYIRTGHDYRASWSLDSHVLSEIAWNLKILKNDDIGCSPLFLDKARAIVHKDEKDFDAEEYAKKLNYDYDEQEWDLGKKLRALEYDNMLEYIALYDYYSNFGIANKELIADVAEFEKKWSKTLPIKPGTYREFDYSKLDSLANKYWNKIWEWMRTYGKVLWS